MRAQVDVQTELQAALQTCNDKCISETEQMRMVMSEQKNQIGAFECEIESKKAEIQVLTERILDL